MLYNNRKFDIRLWVLLTHKMTLHVFKEGHLKVCSLNYCTNTTSKYVHITNYSLPQYCLNIIKFSNNNILSQQYVKGRSRVLHSFASGHRDRYNKDRLFCLIVFVIRQASNGQ